MQGPAFCGLPSPTALSAFPGHYIPLQRSRNSQPAAPLGPHRRWERGTQRRVAGSETTNDQAVSWSLDARTLAGKGSTDSPSWPNHLRRFFPPIGWDYSKTRIIYPIRNSLLRLKRSLVTKGNTQSVKPEDPMRTRKRWIGPNDSPSIKRKDKKTSFPRRNPRSFPTTIPRVPALEEPLRPFLQQFKLSFTSQATHSVPIKQFCNLNSESFQIFLFVPKNICTSFLAVRGLQRTGFLLLF